MDTIPVLQMHDTPQHNGITESFNRRLMEHVCAFLVQSELSQFLWAEVGKFVIWLKNHTPTWILGNVTPFECLTGQKPNLADVPEWGQHVWVYNDSGTKLDRRAMEARWVGYDEDSTHTHRIYWPNAHKVSVECNIRFISDLVTLSMLMPKPSQMTVKPQTQSQQPAPAIIQLQ
jgi:hypothetical protein